MSTSLRALLSVFAFVLAFTGVIYIPCPNYLKPAVFFCISVICFSVFILVETIFFRKKRERPEYDEDGRIDGITEADLKKTRARFDKENRRY